MYCIYFIFIVLFMYYLENFKNFKVSRFYILPSFQNICPQTLEFTLPFKDKSIVHSYFSFSLPCQLLRCVIPPQDLHKQNDLIPKHLIALVQNLNRLFDIRKIFSYLQRLVFNGVTQIEDIFIQNRNKENCEHFPFSDGKTR